MGLIYKFKERKLHKKAGYTKPVMSLDTYGDMEIIEL